MNENMETDEQRAKRLEAFETPLWAVDAILQCELLTQRVWDPCVGRGVMARTAVDHGAQHVTGTDVYDWGAGGEMVSREHEIGLPHDFLEDDSRKMWMEADGDLTIFMNPPFSKAEDFVRKAHEIGARKIICFQRFSWWESAKRRAFWDEFPPNRVYICGNRASCWRFDILENERTSGTTAAHAWFVWEVGQPKGTVMGHIWKGKFNADHTPG